MADKIDGIEGIGKKDKTEAAGALYGGSGSSSQSAPPQAKPEEQGAKPPVDDISGINFDYDKK